MTPKKPMAMARRVSLFEREVTVRLAPVAIDVIHQSATILTEGGLAGDLYSGSTMLTVDLNRARDRISDAPDATTAHRIAMLYAADERCRGYARRIATAEATKTAGCALGRTLVDVESRAKGSRIHLSLDVEAERRDCMIELYSVRDVSRILAVQESRLRYWMQTGFVGPTVRKGGRFYYTFPDLVATKAAKDLVAAGLPLAKIRKNVDALKAALPSDTHPAAKLRICCDGETIVALAEDVAFQPIGGQVVMAFTVPSFGEHVHQVLAMPRVMPAGSGPIDTSTADGAPVAVEDNATEANGGATAYKHFVEACAAEDRGDSVLAEHLFRQAIDLEPTMAAALTNLGNMVYRQGELEEARRLYERAVEHDPNQPEARYNLANLLEDLGETEAALTELRRVCAAAPEFADAHYNLGIMLAGVGGTAQARHHLERYLELDAGSDWAFHARTFLNQLAA